MRQTPERRWGPPSVFDTSEQRANSLWSYGAVLLIRLTALALISGLGAALYAVARSTVVAAAALACTTLFYVAWNSVDYSRRVRRRHLLSRQAQDSDWVCSRCLSLTQGDG
ncbi:hypothetical protein [Deinococcus koreensis]|uniref:hypothetical protein n=1 Tax=Deinococcus koreensis TaxID=2054903 RepID=UPI00105757BE|nr:hypothetical protein [Deinococcus koreensis]